MRQRRKFHPAVNGLEQRLALSAGIAGHGIAVAPMAHHVSSHHTGGTHHTGDTHHTGGTHHTVGHHKAKAVVALVDHKTTHHKTTHHKTTHHKTTHHKA